MSSGLAIAPIFSATNSRSSSRKLEVCLEPFAQRDERRERLALELVRLADHGRLGDRGMLDERALDLHRADAVAGDVQHVVDAAEDPVVAVVVALGAVAREVEVGAARPLREVRLRRSASSSPQIVRSIDGHGLVSASSPPPTVDLVRLRVEQRRR